MYLTFDEKQVQEEMPGSHILAMVSDRVLSFKEASGLSLVFGQFRKYLHLLSFQQHYTIILEFERVAKLPL